MLNLTPSNEMFPRDNRPYLNYVLI